MIRQKDQPAALRQGDINAARGQPRFMGGGALGIGQGNPLIDRQVGRGRGNWFTWDESPPSTQDSSDPSARNSGG